MSYNWKQNWSINSQTGLAVGDVGEVREAAALQKEALQVSDTWQYLSPYPDYLWTHHSEYTDWIFA